MRRGGITLRRALACAVALGVSLAAAQAPPFAGSPPTPRPSPPSSDVTPFESNVEPLTLGECIRRALANNFEIELQQHDLAIAQDELPIAHSLFYPVITADGARSADRTSKEAVLPDLQSTGVSSRLGYTQRLWTGTTVTLGSSLDRYASNQPFTSITGGTLTTNPNSLSYTSGLTLGVIQPLFKGFGTVNTIPIRQAELITQIAEQTYEDRALDVIQRTETAYYLLTGARDQFSVFKTSLTLAERLLKEAEARHTAGMATKIDLLEGRVGVANARLNVLQAQNVVRSSEDQLLMLIGRFELEAPLGSTVVDETPESTPSEQDSYAQALAHQPAIRNARAALELSRLQLALAKDDLKPAVDLALTFGLTGDDRSRNRAFSNAFEPERSAWQAGFSITYPLGRVGEKARFRQATRAQTRDELAIRKLEQDVLVAVRESVRSVRTNQEAVKIAALASNLAQEQYEAERIRYRSGLSTSRRVLEAQKDLEAARVAQLQAKLDLRTALAALYRIEGSSLSRYGITLEKSVDDRERTRAVER
jgi:outer membrane protein